MVSQAANACRVLVTRPAGEAADALSAALVAEGYEAFSQPLLELTAAPQLTGVQRHMLQELDHYQHIIFVSANAVRFGMPWLEDYWPQLPVGINWYGIGDATAKSLARWDIQAITPGKSMTSEGLLALPYLLNVEGQRILIIKGEGGRDALRSELFGRGALVDELACYNRSLPDLPAGDLSSRIEQWGIDVVLLSSGEGLANLLLLLSPLETTKFKPVSLIVPSERVADMARDMGFDRVITAENASDGAMFRALQQWRPGNGE